MSTRHLATRRLATGQSVKKHSLNFLRLKEVPLSVVAVFGLFLLLVFFLILNINVFEKTLKLKKGLSRLEEAMGQALKAKESQSQEMLNAQSDYYLEKIARDELNYQKEGEKAVAFPVVEKVSTSTKLDIESQGFWRWIMEKVK